MPVPPKVGGLDRNDDVVAGAGGNVAVAAGAQIGLGGLIGVHQAHLEFAQYLRVVHRSSPSAQQGPEQQQHGNDDAGRDEDIVGSGALVFPGGIETHGDQYGEAVPDSNPPNQTPDSRPRFRFLIRAIAVAGAVLATSCAAGSPEAPDDPVLQLGQSVFEERCTSCHANDGSGRSAPSIQGVEDEYPDIAQQRAVLLAGRGRMPAFEGVLTDDEITAVVRYTREVL